MSEQTELLKERSLRFALDVCAVIKDLPLCEPGATVRRRLAESATSVAFNYRASCRARSDAELTAALGRVAAQSDETLGWLEFIEAARLAEPDDLPRLTSEAKELLAIFSTSAGVARYKERNRRVCGLSN